MDYARFSELFADVPDAQKNDFKRLKLLTCIGGNVLPVFKEHLAATETLEDFFEAVYQDDGCRFENAWGYWAKMKHPREWADRFEALQVARDVSYVGAYGLPIECNGVDMVWPLSGEGGMDKCCDVYVFADDSFNDAACEFMLSIGGTFVVADMTLEGSFDVYRGPGLVVFEKWDTDETGHRLNRKRQMTCVHCK